MNNAILIQHVWHGEFEPMLELTRSRNEAYCQKHNIDYSAMIGDEGTRHPDKTKGAWIKIELIQRALEQGYEYVIYLDADTIIKDLDSDLRDACIDGIGLCWHRIPQLHHWNVGVLYVKNSIEVKQFIDAWDNTYPPSTGWMEQGEFNKLAMQSKVVQTISDRWNATINYSIVPDAVVLGFHGYGNAAQRFEAMKSTLENLQQKENIK